MRAASPVLGASSAVFLAHAVRTLLAVLMLGEYGSELDRTLAAIERNPSATSGVIDVLALTLRLVPAQLATIGALFVGYIACAPLLHQLVLQTLARPQPLRVALGFALRRYPRALLALVSQGVLLLGCAALALSWRYVGLFVGAFAALFITTLHDLYAAALARDLHRARHGAALCALVHCTPRLLCAHAVLGSAGALLYAAGETGARFVPALVALVLQQTLALAAAFVRAQWHAKTLTAFD